MEQLVAEKRLTVTYVFLAICGAVASITTGIAWGHWKQTLDQCVGRNCSCILYGTHTPSKFLGGSNGYCIWTTFGPLFYIFFSLCLVCFHGYRVLFATTKTSRATRSLVAKLEPGDNVRIQAVSVETTSPLPKAFWVTTSILSAFFTIYSVVHFAMFVSGYYRTCNQYRQSLERMLGIGGSAMPVIHSRLGCQGVFDFMDYVQQDSAWSSRGGFIYTGLDLILGMVASAFSWILYLNATFLNIKLARLSGEEV